MIRQAFFKSYYLKTTAVLSYRYTQTSTSNTPLIRICTLLSVSARGWRTIGNSGVIAQNYIEHFQNEVIVQCSPHVVLRIGVSADRECLDLPVLLHHVAQLKLQVV